MIVQQLSAVQWDNPSNKELQWGHTIFLVPDPLDDAQNDGV
jgi:hypothetical protein